MDENNCINEVFLHKKSGGYYRVLGFALIEATKTHAVIYQDIKSLIVWVRPSSEFFDGRFEFFGKQ